MAASSSSPSADAVAHPLKGALHQLSGLWREPHLDVGDLDTGWIRAETLFADDAMLDDLLDYQASFTPGLDFKGRAAFLITEYSYMFALSVVPLFVGFGLVADLSPRNYALRFTTRPVEHKGRMLEERRADIRFLSNLFFSEGGDGCADRVAVAGKTALDDRFRREIENHFHPLIERLHVRTSLPRHAFWRLVTDSLAAIFLDAGQRFQCVQQAQRDAMTILKKPGSPLNNRQVHYFDISIADDDDPARILAAKTFRARGGCCRYYTVDGGKLCSTCVLKKADDRDRDIIAAMRRRLGLPRTPAGHAAVAKEEEPR